ncbi:MAG: LacI family DNA-binding transcriptional regulator [Verrucomicrobia bacterium]|nr:LacI family DNA-binding transcriptional regulator [Verrucomicrobiota bacterium]
MVTLADIAKQTGVSINTVSLVLRNRPLQIPVRPDTIARIKRVAGELDYRPNRAAQMLRFKRSNLIGLVVREFRHPLFASINQTLIGELERRGFEVLVTDVPDFNDSKHIEDLYNHQIEGLVIGPFYSGPVCPFLRRIADQRFPVVEFFHDGEIAMDGVTIDKTGAVAKVVRHLAGMGHRRIGCIVSNPEHPMLEGYRRAMRDAGLSIHRAWINPMYGGIENGRELGRRILAGRNDPTAYFFHDDNAAIGFMRGLHEHGFRVPQDIAVAGYGDTPIATYNLVSLTSVRLPIQKIVEGIVRQLTARLEKKPVRSWPPVRTGGWQRLVLQGELVVRESSQLRRVGQGTDSSE